MKRFSPGTGARPVEQRNSSHQVDFNDAAGISASGSSWASRAVPREIGVMWRREQHG